MNNIPNPHYTGYTHTQGVPQHAPPIAQHGAPVHSTPADAHTRVTQVSQAGFRQESMTMGQQYYAGARDVPMPDVFTDALGQWERDEALRRHVQTLDPGPSRDYALDGRDLQPVNAPAQELPEQLDQDAPRPSGSGSARNKPARKAPSKKRTLRDGTQSDRPTVRTKADDPVSVPMVIALPVVDLVPVQEERTKDFVLDTFVDGTFPNTIPAKDSLAIMKFAAFVDGRVEYSTFVDVNLTLRKQFIKIAKKIANDPQLFPEIQDKEKLAAVIEKDLFLHFIANLEQRTNIVTRQEKLQKKTSATSNSELTPPNLMAHYTHPALMEATKQMLGCFPAKLIGKHLGSGDGNGNELNSNVLAAPASYLECALRDVFLGKAFDQPSDDTRSEAVIRDEFFTRRMIKTKEGIRRVVHEGDEKTSIGSVLDDISLDCRTQAETILRMTPILDDKSTEPKLYLAGHLKVRSGIKVEEI